VEEEELGIRPIGASPTTSPEPDDGAIDARELLADARERTASDLDEVRRAAERLQDASARSEVDRLLASAELKMGRGAYAEAQATLDRARELVRVARPSPTPEPVERGTLLLLSALSLAGIVAVAAVGLSLRRRWSEEG
jgi:hypothetical protein